MPFILRNLSLTPDKSEQLLQIAAHHCRIQPYAVESFSIVRKAVDARRKSSIVLVYSVSFSTRDDDSLKKRMADIPGLEWQELPSPVGCNQVTASEKIIIVGTGPAGLFAALRLAQYGLAATVVERGQPVEQRAADVRRFWNAGLLDPDSNVQFGEGGAGTFSDGKLTCRSKDPSVPWILRQLADFGAEPDICYLAKPHIGTDRLRLVVANIRHYLLSRGFVIHFGSRMTDIVSRKGIVRSIVVNDSMELPCDRLIVATGHSARDTYRMLHSRGLPLEQKPFAIGLRVEHPQQLINEIQYGKKPPIGLPVADYALTFNNVTTGRSAYSFCMCPGGVVIGGASEVETVVTNGMSSQQRNSLFANSALVVNIRTGDFGATDPLAGVRFQQQWEQQAFRAGGANYYAPAQSLLSFLKRPGGKAISSTYRPGISQAELETVLPDYVTTTLRQGIPEFDKKMRGFVTAEATLIGIESRTSAPVRMPRSERLQSVGMQGVYPAGEGAGYAGGIMSAAVDGVRIADMIAGELGA
jgi:uncharacterized FAD-dependent dehydrogenase